MDNNLSINQQTAQHGSYEESVERKLKGEISSLELIECSPFYEDFMEWCSARGVEPNEDYANLFIEMSEENAMAQSAGSLVNEKA